LIYIYDILIICSCR